MWHLRWPCNRLTTRVYHSFTGMPSPVTSDPLDADRPGRSLRPVLAMQTFTSEAETIQMANDTEYGLSASVFSRGT